MPLGIGLGLSPARLATMLDPTTTVGPAVSTDLAPAKPPRRKPDQSWRKRHLQHRWNPKPIPPTAEERAAARASYAARDRAAAAVIRENRRRARVAEKAAEAARLAQEARRLAPDVFTRIRPPHGRLMAVDVAALLIIGPAGAIGSTSLVIATMAILALGGRPNLEELVGAGWRDEAHLQEGMTALEPKLTALGLRICRRKVGWRVSKLTL